MNPKGTYALILHSTQTSPLQVGRQREMHLQVGYYLYIGSAFGSGGVAARLSRHFRLAKTKHWHIDYLRERATPLFAWVSYDPLRLEHRWATQLSNQPGFTPILGFGCTDCRCRAHLFFTTAATNLAQLGQTLAGNVEKREPPLVVDTG